MSTAPTRPQLPLSRIHPTVLKQMSEYHRKACLYFVPVLSACVDASSDIVDQVETAVDRDPVVVVGMSMNPFVRRCRNALEEAGIPFTYLEYGSYLSQWKERLAIKLWSGYPTFPQVYVRGTLIGGNQETRDMIQSGELRRMLDTAPAAAAAVPAAAAADVPVAVPAAAGDGSVAAASSQ